MKLFVVRHGETELNRTDLMQGWSDGLLIDESLAQDLGKKFIENELKIDKVYSSDLFRTINTSIQILDGMESDLDINHKSDIREFFFGQAEARPYLEVWEEICKHHDYESVDAIVKEVPVLDRVNLIHQTPVFNRAETTEQFKSRIHKGIEEIIAESNEGDNILVVCHGITIFAILEYFGHDANEKMSFDNLSVSEIDVLNRKIISTGKVY